MEIREANYDRDADYIRHVRRETLKSLGITPTLELTEPVPFARYLVAYDNDYRAIGLAESALVGDIFNSYSESPNDAICDLNAYCPIDEMATIRTVYAEPGLRGSSSMFLSLTLASAKLFHGLGARFATATTGVSAHALRRLYLKYDGEIAGEGSVNGIPMTLFVFDLEHLLSHRALKRVAPYFAFEIPKPIKTADVT